MCKSCTSLNLFFLSYAVVHEIVFLIQFSVCLLLVHRNKADFGILILYSATSVFCFFFLCSLLNLSSPTRTEPSPSTEARSPNQRTIREFPLTTLVNCLSTLIIFCSGFFFFFLGFSICKIMSSTNRNSFIFSLPTSISLFSFSHLVALARTSSTTLKRNNDTRYVYLVPDFMGNIFSLLPLNMI